MDYAFSNQSMSPPSGFQKRPQMRGISGHTSPYTPKQNPLNTQQASLFTHIVNPAMNSHKKKRGGTVWQDPLPSSIASRWEQCLYNRLQGKKAESRPHSEQLCKIRQHTGIKTPLQDSPCVFEITRRKKNAHVPIL